MIPGLVQCLASHSSWHVGRHSLLVSYHKEPHRQVAEGSAVAASNPLHSEMCVVQMRFSFQ